jgi:Spy/CpxP family protein refolding chaperone
MISKENNMARRIVLIAMSFSLVLAAVAVANPGRMIAMADKLSLTDQQVEQLRNLKIQYQKEMIRLRADLQLARLELKEVMMKARLDEKAALAMQDRISNIKSSIDRKRLEHMIAARKILTEEQQAKWKKMRREDGPRGRHQRGDGPGRLMGRGPCMGPGMAPPPPEGSEIPGPPDND